LKGLTETDLEDFVLEHSSWIRQLVTEGEADLMAGRVVDLDRYLS
jgi:hypothetical protein